MSLSKVNVITEEVKNYYGKILKTKDDLRTNACCSVESVSKSIKTALCRIEPEVIEKFYGCGSPVPTAIQGCTVLDLGCGSGRDVYLISQFVGETGRVIGVDMTAEQLAIAKQYESVHMERFGFNKTNVAFHQGYIEDLRAIGIEDNSIDTVVSNCVINLSPNKEQVFKEIFRVLKPGGELCFSDVFSNARISDEFRDDPVAYGECLGGAMYIEDFRRILLGCGCPDFRRTAKNKIDIKDPALQKKAGPNEFYSMTIRAFKLDDLEDRCEDFGQVAVYLGGIDGFPQTWMLDEHHVFVKNKPMLVCGNTASMLANSRFSQYFEIKGDKRQHFGLFQCDSVSTQLSLPGSCC